MDNRVVRELQYSGLIKNSNSVKSFFAIGKYLRINNVVQLFWLGR